LVQKEFEDSKVVIRIRKSKKDRQHNGHNKKDKGTNSDLQKATQRTKDRALRTSLETGKNMGVPEGETVPVPLVTY